MTDTTVKFFHSAMPNAPVLSGTAGSLIAVIDACLVNGFAASTVNSLVVASNIATATISGGHSAEVGSVVLVSGATPSGLNGERKVLSVGGGNTTLTYDATGIGNQTATGTISLKLSPAGWRKDFTGTNLAAYKSNDVAATGCLLRVDDSGGKLARCVGYESMTGISTGSGPFPTSGQISGGLYWTKSNAADATARQWVLIADGRIFYLLLRHYSATFAGAGMMCFGDLLSYKSGDAWSCVIAGAMSDRSGYSSGSSDDYASITTSIGGTFLARPDTALGSSCQARKWFSIPIPTSTSPYQSGQGPMRYPNAADNGLYLSEHYLSQYGDLSLRGVSPGLFCSPQGIPQGWVVPHFEIANVAMLPNRTLKVEPYAGDGSTNYGFAFFDVTGPWR